VSIERDAFRRSVRGALACPLDGPLTTHLAAPLVTALIAEAGEGGREALEIALAEVVAALHKVGVPRGRQFVLLACSREGAPAGEPDRLRAALGIPVLVHDPEAAVFEVGRSASGVAFELNDDLREAEAVVAVGPTASARGQLRGGPFLLCPGVASARTIAAWRSVGEKGGDSAAVAFALEVEAAAPVDLALTWDAAGSATAARGRARFEALAREAGLDRGPL